MASRITIALAGNPNSGKTSLFNQLTGARAHVGNYPGVTVQKKEGLLRHQGQEIHVVDLPGTYSLTAYSLEELVARNFILEERPDVVVDVVDAANLERNLYLAVQFMEIGVPVVLALNMIDVAEARGLRIELDKLRQLLGVEIVPTVARKNKGVPELLDAVVRVAQRTGAWEPRDLSYGPELDEKIAQVVALLEEGELEPEKYPPRWVAVKVLEGDSQVRDLVLSDGRVGQKILGVVEEMTRHIRLTLDDEPEGIIADHRYGFITAVTKQTVFSTRDIRRTLSDTIDKVLLNRLLGPLLLLAVLYGIYQFTFWAGETPVVWFEAFFAWLGRTLQGLLPEGPFRSLVVAGLIDGVGGVLGFVPLIAFMFFAIAILEDTGYMARIAFIMDRVLRTFGLHGNSILALMVGGGIAGGCAVPGIMAARTLRDPKERLATILVTPLMNCGAKLPVYALLIGAFFSRNQARMMFLLTLIAWSLALLAARVLRSTVLRGAHTPFVMELPPYRLPTLKGLLIHTWERVWQYVKKAGTIILGVSILIWALMTFPGPPQELTLVFEHQKAQATKAFLAGPGGRVLPNQEALAGFEKAYAVFRQSGGQAGPLKQNPARLALARAVLALEEGEARPPEQAAARAYLTRKQTLAALQAAQAQAALRHSLGGRLGTALETVSRPLGFDWRTNIALIGGFAAKEVVVSTLGTAYALGEVDPEQAGSLSARLAAEPGWNPRVAFTLILFVMIYAPCFATLVVIGRETGTWRWAFFALAYTTTTAYVLALAVAQAGRALGLGG